MGEEKAHSRPSTLLRQSIWRYGPLLAWMAVIFFASTGAFSGQNTSLIIRPLLLWLFPNISDERIALAHLVVRKIFHFGEYAILGMLAARAFYSAPQRSLRRRWFLISLLLVILYSLSDEYHQSFVPSRGPSIYDSLIDTAGGLFALLLYALKRKRKETQGRRRAEARR